MTLLLAVPAAIFLGVLLWDLTRSPSVRRLAMRRARRRPADALFVVLGSLLATTIISASFFVGDTLNGSIRDLARTQYGPADEAVVATGLETVPALETALADPVPGTDGLLTVVSAPVTATHVARDGDRRSQALAQAHEVAVPEARRFGGDETATGFAGIDDSPERGEALVGEDLAADLAVRRGDNLEVFAYGRQIDVEVTTILPRLGVAGFYPSAGSRSPVLFLAPGTLEAAIAGELVPVPPTVRVLVSNDGGVFDGVEGGSAVREELVRRLADVTGAEVQALKQQILDTAAAEGRATTQLFTGIGGFAVVAGVLLLVNLFVMQAEERRSELGLLRAVGMRRHRLARVFGFEGGLYAVVASILGTASGVGVARLIVAATAELLAKGDTTLDLRFSATGESLVAGGLIGLTISLVTVWLTSVRIGRLQVVDAVSELPSTQSDGHPLAWLVTGAVGVVGGGALAVVGLTWSVGIAALTGPVLVLLSAIPLLSRILPSRFVVTVLCGGALVWGVMAFPLLPRVFEGSGITLFLVQGVLLVAAGTTLTTVNAQGYLRLAQAVLPRGRLALAAKLGFAYPLARPVRTGLLIGMYALVIFTLTFTAVFTRIFAEQAPLLTEASSAAYDLLVDSNPASPAAEADLRSVQGVADTTTLLRGFVQLKHPALGAEPRATVAAGIDETLVARRPPALTERDGRFRDDAEAWQAVLADPTLAVVSDLALQESGGLPGSPLEAGDRFELIDPSTETSQTLTVAGVTTADVQLNGLLVQRPVLEGLLGPRAVANRHYVVLDDGAEPEAVAGRLEGELFASGVDARPFRDVVDEALSEQRGFFRLMQGFLSLGLVVGIAGLAVVMIRAVRERRRQIGMLRAIGFEARSVRSAFLVEAGFIAVRGVLLGTVLGLVVSWTLLAHSDIFADAGLAFVVPWGALAIVMGAPLLMSLLAAIIPASRAAAVLPTVALRVAP